MTEATPVSLDALMRDCGLPRIEARALLAHVTGHRREWLIAHGDAPVDAGTRARFEALARRRLAGEPLAYLVGTREFLGRAFLVSPDVLIPRPDTEVLVAWVIGAAPRGGTALDLGTGSGAIAVSLALERPDLSITATDASGPALEIARQNALRLGAARISFAQGDWFDALAPGARFDLIASNPPYIASDDPHLRAGDLRFEPDTALTDGGDGLGALRRIVRDAPAHLRPGGCLGLEHGWDQGAAVRTLLRESGFGDVRTLVDDEGRDRVGLGRWATSP